MANETRIYGFLWTAAGELIHRMSFAELGSLYGFPPRALLHELLRLQSEAERDPAPLRIDSEWGTFFITLTPQPLFKRDPKVG